MGKRRTAIIAMTLAGSSSNGLLRMPSRFVQNTPRETDALQKEGWVVNVVHHLNHPSHYIYNTHCTGRWNEYEDALENLQDNGILDPRRALAVELNQRHGANRHRHILRPGTDMDDVRDLFSGLKGGIKLPINGE